MRSHEAKSDDATSEQPRIVAGLVYVGWQAETFQILHLMHTKNQELIDEKSIAAVPFIHWHRNTVA